MVHVTDHYQPELAPWRRRHSLCIVGGLHGVVTCSRRV
jgi:hypothetical protein